MRINLSSALTPLLLSALTAVAAHPLRTAPSQDAHEEEETVLHGAMETLNHGQRGLRKLLREPADNRAAILDTLTGMERAAVTALGELPPRLEGISEAELPLWHVGYKRTMTTLLQQVLAMEQAALENDGDALNAAYAELGRIKTAGHEEYREP